MNKDQTWTPDIAGLHSSSLIPNSIDGASEIDGRPPGHHSNRRPAPSAPTLSFCRWGPIPLAPAKKHPDRIHQLAKTHFNIKTPKPPFPHGTERDYLQVGGSKTHASRAPHQSFLRIRILETFSRETRLNALLSIRHLPGSYPASLNNFILYFAGLMRGENVKFPPGLKFP